MKVLVLTSAAVALCVGVAAFALHFELSARSEAYHEILQLRGQTHTDLDSRRITQAKAERVDGRLNQASLELEQDDVRGAQRLLDGVKAELAGRTRAA